MANDFKYWLFTVLSGGLTTWIAGHHPELHDPAMILLGVIAHRIGIQHARSQRGSNGSSSSPAAPAV